ncbi:ciliogenesis-associated TTC17-interacting protein [Lates japonicus]
MSAKDTLRSNKILIQTNLCGDYVLILGKIYEKKLITDREHIKLKNINNQDVEGHVIALMDKIMGKGEDTCKKFLDLLLTDKDVEETYPDLKDILLKNTSRSPETAQACPPGNNDVSSQESKRPKKEEKYQLKSQPLGLCVIINNENFMDYTKRRGTDKDAQRLAEVFSWLGFKVLMCKDQTRDKMDQALNYFASLNENSQLQEFSVKEWFGTEFIDSQQVPKHGDAFICCILSHGEEGVVCGIDWKPLSIKRITRTFKATEESALRGKPKVFLIQACQGGKVQRGVPDDLEADASPSSSSPEYADVLVAIATVEEHKAFRDPVDGSWFIQSLCQQLEERCKSHEDIETILRHVKYEVSQKEGSSESGAVKQMAEVRNNTLLKTLVLSAHLP